MRIFASLINELGRSLDRRGYYRAAAVVYATAMCLSPRWAVPWFNRGLMAKFARRWHESLRFNLRATELDPSFMPAWWNLGIAATALGDWAAARRAWTGYGITVPPGEGPLDMALGAVPIRINPHSTPEIVWCERLDPARARIACVPFPDSGCGCDDVLLTDGEPRGYREYHGREVPVFNELEVLSTSGLSTFTVTLSVPDEQALKSLFEIATQHQITVEDWSAVDLLCGACSEGRPHAHAHQSLPSDWKPSRHIGFAATDSAQVQEVLAEWVASDPARITSPVECLLPR